eukprot:snap_masked-scaffold_12-processed-gene-12.58-mRNA-1 protein AED:0.03 eAED:0.03 QI:0/-1/0/1/-1/1/1/0/254
MSEDLLLDPQIRDWVLLPIVYIMLLVGVGRSMVTQLMKDNSPPNADIAKYKQVLSRSQRVRKLGGLLTPTSFSMRKDYFCKKKTGKFREKVPAGPVAGGGNPMESAGMQNMLKQNMVMMIPNMVMFGWISYFFSGFVLVKVPFSLTDGFRDMLQRGINLDSLDVSYVSSLSWYFLVMFGARGLFSLILGSQNVFDDTEVMQQQMGKSKTAQQEEMQFDASKEYKKERRLLKHAEPKPLFDEFEHLLLGKPFKKN